MSLLLGFYSKGFDVLEWLQYPENLPPVEYLISTAISMPLIGFTQLLNYWIMVKVLNKVPHEIRALFQGSTGHSQGEFIVSIIFINLEVC